MTRTYDYLIIGSGAGGAAAAHRLGHCGARVLVLEKGEPLPRDGSTLDPDKVLRQGAFLSREPWLDGHGHRFMPEEHFNPGGKTKWYGAALLRFADHEFAADPDHRCLSWPFGPDTLEPYYARAEGLLGVRRFPVEADFARIANGLARRDPGWVQEPLSVGLAATILDHPDEARHWDGFASVRGLKRDAETCLLADAGPAVTLLTGAEVTGLTPDPSDPRRVLGARCADGRVFAAETVLLAAGALHSPRLLQGYLAETGLDRRLPCADQVGRNYKCHLLTALLAFGHRPVRDRLCKTALLLHAELPHSSVQTLGGNLGEEIVRARLPRRAGPLIAPVARRAYGFFLQTEDGSHPDNRVIAAADGLPRLDYDPDRLPEARDEHRRLVRRLSEQLRGLGLIPVAKPIPLAGTAHACGTLVAGTDPRRSVVDPEGRVQGMANLYVVDGSVLPRSSRVNPALGIFAWSLRVADGLTDARGDAASRRPTAEVSA